MGNADLRNLASIATVDIESIANSTVAVDAPNWLYKYLTTTTKFTDTAAYTTDDGQTLPNLIGVPRGLVRFYEHGIRPVFVFDGDPHELKADEIASRRKSKEQAADKAREARERGDSIAAARFESRTQRLDAAVLQTTKDLLDLFDIPYFVAPRAAEAQAAAMTRTDAFDYTISDDYDALLFGSPATVRNFTSASKPLEILDLAATCEAHSLTVEQLVAVGVLCGTDYNEGVKGVGVKTAVAGLQEYGDLETFLAETGRELDGGHAVRDIFVNAAVSETYPSPTAGTPDVDGVREYVSSAGVDISLIDSSLITIAEQATQTGLDQW